MLTVRSGDTVVVDTVSGGPGDLPGEGFHVPPELLAIHAGGPPAVPGHILTGPIAVEGARPGHVLEVRVREVALRQDWGYNVIRPLAGTLPYDFETERRLTIPIDVDAGTARLPWGLVLPLRPFFGGDGGRRRRRDGAASPRSSRARTGATSTSRSSCPARASFCRCWASGSRRNRKFDSASRSARHGYAGERWAA